MKFIYDTNKAIKNCYIYDINVKIILQEAAEHVYGIECRMQLARFSSNSIRVGAFILFHVENISAEDIKFCLRWRSDSFRMYLRNIIQLAERHKDAIRNAA